MSAQTAGEDKQMLGGGERALDIDKASSLSSFYKSARRQISLPGLIYYFN